MESNSVGTEDFVKAMEAQGARFVFLEEEVDPKAPPAITYCACGAKELENPETPECCT